MICSNILIDLCDRLFMNFLRVYDNSRNYFFSLTPFEWFSWVEISASIYFVLRSDFEEMSGMRHNLCHIIMSHKACWTKSFKDQVSLYNLVRDKKPFSWIWASEMWVQRIDSIFKNLFSEKSTHIKLAQIDFYFWESMTAKRYLSVLKVKTILDWYSATTAT